MNYSNLRAAFAAISTLTMSLAAQDSGNVIPFQGQLADQSGQPLTPTSPITIVFRLYQTPVGGVAIWEEGQPNISVNGGRFSVLLGSRQTLPARSYFNATLYLGLTVDDGDPATTDVEMRPRQALVPVISARYATDADKLNGFDWSALFDNGNPQTGFISGSRLAPASVPSAKLSGGTIGGQTFGINGQNGNRNVLLESSGNEGGFIGLYDSSGNQRMRSIVSGGFGHLDLYGQNGNVNISLSSSGGDFGWFGVYDADGNYRTRAFVSGSGYGGLSTFGPNGNINFHVSTISGNENLGFLGLYDADGNSRTRAFVSGSGSGGLSTYGPNGNSNFRVSTISGNVNHGFLGLYDGDGNSQTRAFVFGSGHGGLSTYGPNGNINFQVSATSASLNHGFLGLYDANGNAKARLVLGTSGSGGLTLLGANGNANIALTTISGNENLGFISAQDGGGTTKAALYVNSDGRGVVARDLEVTSSDRRLKEDIRSLETSLEKVKMLRGVSYLRRTSLNSTAREIGVSAQDAGAREIGVVAQEVREAIPEAVVEIDLDALGAKDPESPAQRPDSTPTLYVNYDAIVAVLIEAVKEQQVHIDDLEARLTRLEGERRNP